MRVGLSPEARADRREAEGWYRRQSPSAAARFRLELREALEFIAQYPFGGRSFRGDMRAKTLPRFPFAILYFVLPDRVRVVAIADERREPGTYENRR